MTVLKVIANHIECDGVKIATIHEKYMTGSRQALEDAINGDLCAEREKVVRSEGYQEGLEESTAEAIEAARNDVLSDIRQAIIKVLDQAEDA